VGRRDDAFERTDHGGSSAWRWIRRVLVLLFIVGFAYALWIAWDHQEAIMAWKRQASPLVFFAAMALIPALGVPITPFFVLAGATFGRELGLLGSGIALAVNLTLCYWIARSALRPWLVSLLRRFHYELPDFEKRGRRGSFRFTLAVKLAPGVPGAVKSYGLGVAAVPFWLYLGVSMLVTGVYAAALVIVGQSLLEHRLDRAAIAGGVVIVLGLGLWWWRKRRDTSRLRPLRPHEVAQ
jgi:uncharacterized membrane protein YdjX (TVP38/TMEM64 family)